MQRGHDRDVEPGPAVDRLLGQVGDPPLHAIDDAAEGRGGRSGGSRRRPARRLGLQRGCAVGQCREDAHVQPRAEPPTLARQHDHPDRRVGPDLVRGVDQRREHGEVDGVELLGPAQAHIRHSVGHRDPHTLGHGCAPARGTFGTVQCGPPRPPAPSEGCSEGGTGGNLCSPRREWGLSGTSGFPPSGLTRPPSRPIGNPECPTTSPPLLPAPAGSLVRSRPACSAVPCGLAAFVAVAALPAAGATPTTPTTPPPATTAPVGATTAPVGATTVPATTTTTIPVNTRTPRGRAPAPCR